MKSNVYQVSVLGEEDVHSVPSPSDDTIVHVD